jgi:5'-3' exonuclease
MTKNKRHTLVIDGNYFLFRTLYVAPQRSKSKPLLDDKDDMQSFISKLATDLSYQVRLFEGLIDKVVWTVDSRSWRKDFYPEADYKGNRKQDSNINWSNFSTVSNDFIDILESKGVQISKINGAEGDDLMFAWNAESIASGKSVIMFTGDKDIVQLVNKSDNGAHTIVFSPAHKKIYAYNGFSEWMNASNEAETDNIFDMIKLSTSPENQIKKLLQTLITKKKVNILEVDPEEFRFAKVLTGDGGDNVLPAYWYIQNNRRYGISDKKSSEIIAEFKKSHGNLSYKYLYNNELVIDLANIIFKVMKVKHMSIDQIITNIRSNVNLMVLSSESIPSGILDEMFNHIESVLDKIVPNLTEISSMKLLLENSSYKIKENLKGIPSKIFKNNEDDSTDFSFIKDRNSTTKIF